jgi:hypothetical protein
MQFIGVAARAKQARAALNRLRWEADQAIAAGRADDVASSDLAEVVGILTNILTSLEEALPDRPTDELEELLGSARARFVGHMRFYTEYHRTAR